MRKRLKLLVLVASVIIAGSLPAESRNLSELPEVPLASIQGSPPGKLGKKALSIGPDRWKHSESDHFIYHYYDNFVATSVYVEGEYYYRAIAGEIGEGTMPEVPAKPHIYIFQSPEAWKIFQKSAELDPWTGGIQSENELFIVRDVKTRFQDQTLGHEIAHLVVNHFFGDDIPLWLNEGYAENSATRAFAGFMKGRNKQVMARYTPVSAAQMIPLAELSAIKRYPKEEASVSIFYVESEALVRFLMSKGREKFIRLFKEVGKGKSFEAALQSCYSDSYPSLVALEPDFRKFIGRGINE